MPLNRLARILHILPEAMGRVATRANHGQKRGGQQESETFAQLFHT
jgi:hypothetical protein